MSQVALKIDVDTYRGTREGVPRLLSMLDGLKIPATFYVTLGPDRSGLAIRRVFRKGFLSKMRRTKAGQMYGWKTMMYGTLLPAPVIAKRCRPELETLLASGHEVGLHCWDHVTWHDKLWTMSPDEARRHYRLGLDAFRDVAGRAAEASAAPAWRTRSEHLAQQEEAGLAYASDTRGRSPFFPHLDGRTFTVLQVPMTVPTLDELLGLDGRTEADVAGAWLDACERPGTHVLGLHAESEGGAHAPWFREVLGRMKDRGVRFIPLREAAREALRDRERVPACRVEFREIPGRAGEVSCQGEPLSAGPALPP